MSNKEVIIIKFSRVIRSRGKVHLLICCVEFGTCADFHVCIRLEVYHGHATLNFSVHVHSFGYVHARLICRISKPFIGYCKYSDSVFSISCSTQQIYLSTNKYESNTKATFKIKPTCKLFGDWLLVKILSILLLVNIDHFCATLRNDGAANPVSSLPFAASNVRHTVRSMQALTNTHSLHIYGTLAQKTEHS